MGIRKKVLEHFEKAQQSIEDSKSIVASLPEFVPPSPKVVSPAPDTLRPAPKVSSPKIQPTSTAEKWPNSKIVGSKLTKKESDAILRQSQDDQPWLILVALSGAGVLAAFDDRLTIIKVGSLTSLRASSMWGERVATFYFREVTGFQYKNEEFFGLLGVLEVLTASHDGTDNEPQSLSNTLPLTKDEYNNALGEIKELQKRIARSKDQVVLAPPAQQPPSTNTSSLGDELVKLAELHKAGILSDDEFQSAKKRMLG